MAIFTGSGVAIVTPFGPDGSVDYGALRRLIEFQIAGGSDAIIVCGTTGEASTLTDEEQIETIRFAAETVGGRVPVVAGAGSNDTRHGVKLCELSARAGADALLLVTPYYNKTSPRGLIAHYTECAKATDLPIILYNIPGRTGLNVLPETMLALSEIDGIVAVKEACGNIEQVAALAALCRGRLDIYSGNDDQTTALMSLGGVGVISTVANIIPGDMHEMCAAFLAGDTRRAAELQLRAVPLIKQVFNEVNPIPIKAALNMMGLPAGGYRLPLVPPSEENQAKLRRAMEDYGIKLAV
ncbi:MAG: 4-hydroxy-tetrahydrodipicolinate synthase [Clostridiales bacterium]|jgi:4-hydroxy-tetrahydrodipicolinate synthase|nr:4-hydroxy-tetrahydrodipicolinate synthase [Clostridiales bacterium]